jgi:hypothetical protein
LNQGTFSQLLKTIDHLISLGVIPILTFAPETILKDGKKNQQLGALYAAVYKGIKKQRLPVQWLKNLSPFMMPLEGRFFLDDPFSTRRSFWDWLLTSP